MPTRSKRAIRRARRLAAALWWAGAAFWGVLILWTQRPWAGLDELQTTQWLIGGLGGLLVGTLQLRGKDYWPANTLLGLAYGSDKAMYFGLTQLVFHGDAAAFRAWAGPARIGLVAWGVAFGLLIWAFYLVVRVNSARNGSSIDLWGRARPPSEAQVLEAGWVWLRAARHGLGNVLTRPEFAPLADYLIQQREAVWFTNPAAQLAFERERAARRIAAAEARVAEARGGDAHR